MAWGTVMNAQAKQARQKITEARKYMKCKHNFVAGNEYTSQQHTNHDSSPSLKPNMSNIDLPKPSVYFHSYKIKSTL